MSPIQDERVNEHIKRNTIDFSSKDNTLKISKTQ